MQMCGWFSQFEYISKYSTDLTKSSCCKSAQEMYLFIDFFNKVTVLCLN